MAVINGQSFSGTALIDLTPLLAILVDVAPGGLVGARPEQEGIDDAVTEVLKSLPTHAETIGVSANLRQRVIDLNTNIASIRAMRADVDKAAEVLKESEAKYVNDREVILAQIADAAKSAARRGDSSALAPFEKTVAYNSRVGLLAAQTRRRNEQAAAEEAAEQEAAAKAAAEKKAAIAKALAEKEAADKAAAAKAVAAEDAAAAKRPAEDAAVGG